MKRSTIQQTCLLGAAAAMTLGLAMGTVLAADKKFPSDTIQVVTHAGAGGGTDITTRMMLMRARRVLKTDMVVVSKKGGGGATAMKFAAKKPRDGYTLMTITPTHLATIAQGKAGIKIDDLVGLARGTDDPQLLMAKKGTFKDIKDLLAQGKTRKIKVGGTFVGGIDHITAFTFAKKANMQMNYIPYKGGGNIVTSLIGGDIEIGVLNLSEADSQIKAGEISPLIVLAAKRMGPIPDVPTSVELGLDVKFSTVRGFVTLKGPSAANLKTLEKGIVKAMKHKYFQGFLAENGLGPDSVVGAEGWNAQIKDLYRDTAATLKELGMAK